MRRRKLHGKSCTCIQLVSSDSYRYCLAALNLAPRGSALGAYIADSIVGISTVGVARLLRS